MADNNINYSTQKNLYFISLRSFRQNIMVIKALPWTWQALSSSSIGQTLLYIISTGHKSSIPTPNISRRRKGLIF